MSNSLKAAKEMGKKVAKGLGYAVACPFAVPTFVRKSAEKNSDWGDPSMLLPSMFVGIPVLTVGIVCLAYGLGEGSPYKLACGGIILSSNAISGLYEWYRYEKNKIENSASEIKKAPSKLEVKVEEPTKSVNSKFVNPWEIEIKD